MPETQQLPYEPASAASIEAYAKRLLGHSLREFIEKDFVAEYQGRGSFGQMVEHAYFHYAPNSNSEPDFPEAGLELKTTPLKRIRTGYSSKERLVLNIIDYHKEHAFDFETSSFWRKNKHILLLMYLYEKNQEILDYIFKIVQVIDFPENDLKIIRDDWEKIVTKIRAGRAHELSEGDTFYLGACTKGANSNSLRTQPFSSEMAMQRAFSLKSKYLNFLIADSEIHKEVSPIIKDSSQYKKGETFEEYVTRQFKPYYGMTEDMILEKLGKKITNSKHKRYLVCMAILGVDKKAEEFEKADILLKTIKLEQNGSLKESMSFEQIKYQEIVQEEWEESYWYETIHKRFFFVVFRRNGAGELILEHTMFWAMPLADRENAEIYWQDIKQRVSADDYDNFYKSLPDRLFHVRPKARNAKDLMPTPAGGMAKKKAYWFNRTYILRIINGNV